MVSRKSQALKVLIAATGVWLFLTVLAFTIMNQPQCPAHFTQAHVDASGCILGANIGLGLFNLFIMLPFSILLLALWSFYLIRRANNKGK